MRKNKILEKLLAIILIFTLTSANFMFVTKSFASSFAETLFGMKSDTGHKNVEFEAYFGTEEEKETSVISDVNNEELAISMDLNIKETGYLKDAKIEIAETEEGKGLNFKLKNTGSRPEIVEENSDSNPFLDVLESEENNDETVVEENDEVILPEGVQSIEDNVITLQQVNSNNELQFNLPIEYKNESFVNENKFSNDCLVKFTGIYVDDDGEENEISKEYTLNVSWKDERDVRVSSSVEKYIDYEKGVILQTLVRVDNSSDRKTLPVKESSVTIDVPNYLDARPSNITVVANNTMATNGQTPETINFGTDNWYYNQDENKLVITVNNEKQLVTVDEYEEEYLKEADKEIIEEERYYNGSAYDEYLITYTYSDVTAPQEPVVISSNIEAKMTTFSGVESEEFINIVTNNNNYEYSLDGKTGDIVSLYIETETGDVSKAYAYANYNNSERYEVDLKSNTLVNISYKEIINGLNVEDIENVYIDKEGNRIPNNDLFYKQISIAKENFTNILGEEGTIRILGENGNEIFTINNETEVNENGFIVVTFQDRYSRLNYEISKPIDEGNLIINNVKQMRNATIDKATLANVDSISTKVAIRADYSYVENRVEIGTAESIVKLNDTTSKVNLVLDRESLSTLATNSDVEMRIELNNAVDTSDMFGHSIYEVTLPESIESVEVTNASILYGEGLDIVSAVFDPNTKTIRIEIDGKQEGINSGVLTNGTNIVINANLKVNLFTPAKSENITLKYSNDEATSYADEGNVQSTVSYSAPTGLVAVNSMSNYNNLGATITSVRQGEKEDVIDIYAEAKQATMEVIVMNNNNNTISNLAVLGRIPFKGVKDIATGDDLGTTLDTKLLSGITPDEHNKTEVKVYYSENGEATKDLNDTNNGWTQEPQSLENIKSYLIVPVDENYEMESTDILRFTYTYEIPANLTHNEDIYGTFLAYYTNNSEVATTDEEAVPDKVGLTTGAGPELSIETSVSRDKMKEQEEVQVNIVATNTGSSTAEDVVVELPIPQNASYVSHDTENENATINFEENKVKLTIPKLEREEKVEFTVTLKAEKSEDSNSNIEVVATVSAKDLDAVVKSETKKIEVAQAELEITEQDRAEIDDEKLYTEGTKLKLNITVKNLTRDTLNNIIVEKTMPEEFTFTKGYVIGYEADGLTEKEEVQAEYDESSRTVTLRTDSLDGLGIKQIIIEGTANALPEDTTKRVVETTVSVRADGTDTYVSNQLPLTLAKPVLVLSQTTDRSDTYLKEGDTITYTFTVRNEGEATARSVVLTDEIPEGLTVQRITYVANGIPVDRKISSNENAVVRADIEPNNELVVNVKALASSLKGAEEKTITNYATISGETVAVAQSNEITHIIEANQEYRNISVSDQEIPDVTVNQATQANIDKTYKINGTAWLDSNENGTRDDGEELLSGISAKLVNSETGIIQKSVTTDSAGNYSFAGISNGSYLIIFDYDTVKYTVTAYNKDGVATNVNSDVVTTKIDQDGKSRNAAITDVIAIANGSVSNIDIGLVLADTFDLKLDKTITKVSVQTSRGMETDEYEGSKLAKTEIAAKYVSGSTVFVEYTMIVSNVGDVAGYAKKIIDYIPEGMSFNSSLRDNQGWYTGTDGNLYYTGLENTELKSNESKTIKLVLTKQMTDENTGLVNNIAEIYEDYNIYGISDCNSTPANKAQGENDLGFADISILIKTGETFIYVSVIITTILLGSIVIFIAYNKIVLVKRKGGV